VTAQAYADYNDLMNMTEDMLIKMVEEVNGGSLQLAYHADGPDAPPVQIDFKKPWRRISMARTSRERAPCAQPSVLVTAGLAVPAQHGRLVGSSRGCMSRAVPALGLGNWAGRLPASRADGAVRPRAGAAAGASASARARRSPGWRRRWTGSCRPTWRRRMRVKPSTAWWAARPRARAAPHAAHPARPEHAAA